MAKAVEQLPEHVQEEPLHSEESQRVVDDLNALAGLRSERTPAPGHAERLSLREFPEAAKILDRNLRDERVHHNLEDLKQKSEWNYTHSLGVAKGAMALASLNTKLEGLTSGDMELLAKASLLHDVGKADMDPALINKPGALTDAEFAIVSQHSSRSSDRITHDFPGDGKLRTLVDLHHQFQDKAHYKSADARYLIDSLDMADDERRRFRVLLEILETADKFDAMAFDRPYRDGKPPQDVEEILFHELEPHGVNLKFARQIIDMHFPRYYDNAEAQ